MTNRARSLPPLDLDFFQQLARLPACPAGERLLEFVRSEFGTEVGLSMEQFFSEADYTDRFHSEFNIDRGPTVKRYGKALQDFLRALPVLLDETTSMSCDYHGTLASLLYTQDCVLTFNYDCVIDRALRDNAQKRWDPDKDGYGFTPMLGGDQWRDHASGRTVKGTIRLLKMHGSRNWAVTADGIELRPDGSGLDSLRDSIIPPTWFKNLQQPPFERIWKLARTEVRGARIIVVIGYSVPATDLFSRSLFKVEAGSKEKREKLDLLVLVNPDRAARSAFVELVRGGIEASTRILEFDTFAELDDLFARHVPEIGPRPKALRLRTQLEREVISKLATQLVEKLSEQEVRVLRLMHGEDGFGPMGTVEVAEQLGLGEDELNAIYRRAQERFEMIVLGAAS